MLEMYKGKFKHSYSTTKCTQVYWN